MTHIHLTRCLPSTINLAAVTGFLLTFYLHCCQQRIFNWNTSYFRRLESAFHQLFCGKFSFKLINFSQSYATKQDFFWTQCISGLFTYFCRCCSEAVINVKPVGTAAAACEACRYCSCSLCRITVNAFCYCILQMSTNLFL